MSTAFQIRSGRSHTAKTKKPSTKDGADRSSAMPIFLQRATVFPKLKSGQPKDAYEQEADRISSSVEFPGRAVQGAASQATSSTGGGLPVSTRDAMEEKLGADFSNVRIHADAQAGRMSNALGANAFTTGNDIYFNENRYDPYSKAGQALLAHELVHVNQQRGPAAGRVQCSLMESLASTGLGGFEIGMETRSAPLTPGMEGTIKFFPASTGPFSTEIALIQTASVLDASGGPLDWAHDGTGSEAPRNEVRTPLSGAFIDAIYADNPRGSAVTPNYVQPADMAARPTQNFHGWLRSPTDTREASLYDYPGTASPNADFNFETVAKGTDNQVVYGSLEWGFTIRSGVVQDEYRHPHALESAEFDDALERFRGYYTHEPIVLYFDTDKDLPKAGELSKLGDVTSYMGRYSDVTLQVEGYADETGPPAHNRDLSLRRADNVVTILTGMGVDPERIDSLTVGHGATTAFSAGSPAAAAGSLQANRRAVITFVRYATTPVVL